MFSRLVRPLPSALGNFGQLNAFQPSQVTIVRLASSAVTAPADESNKLAKKRPTIEEVLRSDAVSKIPEGPERDLVNFPRPKRIIHPPACSWGFIPESYFRFFYPKLGATGGWTFGLGLTTFLLSKEIWVVEHEFWVGVSMSIILFTVLKKFGKQIGEYNAKGMQDIADKANANKFGEIDVAEEGIEHEKKAQWQAEAYKLLFQAKRENVAFQQEAAYRERLMTVFREVKRKLDYQVEKQNAEKNVAQRHMVNWIINKVTKSITAEQEQENIKKCIADLKLLAVRT